MDASYLSLLPKDDKLVQSYGKVVEKVGQINGVTVVSTSDDPVALMGFIKVFLDEVNKDNSVVVRFMWPVVGKETRTCFADRTLVKKLSGVEPEGYESSAQGVIFWCIGLWDYMLSSGTTTMIQDSNMSSHRNTIDDAINPLVDLLEGTGNEEVSLAVSVTPRGDGLNVEVLKRTYAIVNSAAQKATQGRKVTYGLTGIGALAHDEEQLLMSEVFRLGTGAFVIIICIFIWFSGSVRLIPVVFLPLTAGTVIGLGFYGFRTSTLNMVTAVFPVMIFGLGIDYALYMISEVAARQKKGVSLESALCRGYLVCMRPIAASALTTAAAFFALSFANFAGIAELGFLAGLTILSIALATLTLLPFLVSCLLSELSIRQVNSDDLATTMNRSRLLFFAISFALFAYGATQCTYNDDLLAVQPQTLPSRIVQQKLGNAGLAESVIIFCPPHQKQETWDFLEKTMGFSVHSLSLSSRDVSILEATIRTLDKRLKALERAPSLREGQIAALVASLDELKKVHEEAGDLAFAAGLPFDEEAAERTGERIENLMRKCSSLTFASMIDDRVKKTLNGGMAIVHSLTKKGGLIHFLKALIERTKGYELLIAKGDRSIWYGGAAEKINIHLAKEGLVATGPVLIFQRLAEIVKADVWRAIFLAAFAVFVTLLLTFRRLSKTLAALAPLIAGYVAMAGGLGLLRIPLTIGNVAAFPLLFGIGIDYGIHVVERTRVTGRGEVIILGRDGLDRAMFVAAATTLTGFLALSISRHPGLSSFGVAVALGIAGSAVTARLISPLLLLAGVNEDGTKG